MGAWPSASVSSPVKWGKSAAASEERSTTAPPCLALRSCWEGQLLPGLYCDLRRPGMPTPPPGTPAQTTVRCGRGGRGRVAFRPTGPLCAALNYHLLKTTRAAFQGFHFSCPPPGAGGHTEVSVQMRTKNFLPTGGPGCGPDGRAGVPNRAWKAHLCVPACPEGSRGGTRKGAPGSDSDGGLGHGSSPTRVSCREGGAWVGRCCWLRPQGHSPPDSGSSPCAAPPSPSGVLAVRVPMLPAPPPEPVTRMQGL